ncbi:carbon-nitrogen hydrolase family protein [Dactylosporangium sp. CA-092794]|uniref:carbon-nitrogen hydrolase family protein n=1 Tax=Dactylosporangium sp. CA-092794 TaxID=3239929 RepID=UPI003D931894
MTLDVRPRQHSAKTVMGGLQSVRVAVVQRSHPYLDRHGCVDAACVAIAEAGRNGAKLVVFPESWLAGYPYWTDGWNTDRARWIEGRVRFYDAAVLAPSEDTERLAAAARAAGTVVVMGCNELDPRPESDTIYGSLLVFDADGTLVGRHRKLVPTGQERTFWGTGDGNDLAVFDTAVGRVGGLICGEHSMTLVRAALIAQREDFHVSVFHGSFSLQKGPTLVENDTQDTFIGWPLCRAHAIESGAFTLMACTYFDPADFPEDFPYRRDELNLHHSNGGSAVLSPLGAPLAGPVFDAATIVYADCPSWIRKARAALLDTFGHYGRPDLLRLLRATPDGWSALGGAGLPARQVSDAVRRAAERHEVDERLVLEALDATQR